MAFDTNDTGRRTASAATGGGAPGAAADAKRERIVSAALAVFGRHGYRRTSMDLLARAAGMSRPALYQYFAGKAAVFEAVGAWLVEQAGEAADRAAAGTGPAEERLCAVLAVKLELVTGSVEAEARRELVAEAGTHAAGVQAALRTRLARAAADVLGELPALSGERAHGVAAVLVDAAGGIAQEAEAPDVLRDRVRDLVHLVVRGLAA